MDLVFVLGVGFLRVLLLVHVVFGTFACVCDHVLHDLIAVVFMRAVLVAVVDAERLVAVVWTPILIETRRCICSLPTVLQTAENLLILTVRIGRQKHVGMLRDLNEVLAAWRYSRRSWTVKPCSHRGPV